MTLLENQNIQLRAVEPEDIDLLYKWENDPNVWHISNTLLPFSRFTIKEYIENSTNDLYEQKQLRLMIVLKQEQQTIGTIDLFEFDPFHQRVGVGILIQSKEHRRKQYASQSLELLIQYVFDHLLLNQMYCNILTNNTASIKLFQNNGFQINGVKKSWVKSKNNYLDEYFLQLIREDL